MANPPKPPPMIHAQLLEFHKAFCQRAYDIMAVKNHDYAGATGDTPFANFQAVELLGIASTETGFLVRMLDKMKRLQTFAACGKLKVENEGAYDACLDIANYAILLAAYVKDKGAK